MNSLNNCQRGATVLVLKPRYNLSNLSSHIYVVLHINIYTLRYLPRATSRATTSPLPLRRRSPLTPPEYRRRSSTARCLPLGHIAPIGDDALKVLLDLDVVRVVQRDEALAVAPIRCCATVYERANGLVVPVGEGELEGFSLFSCCNNQGPGLRVSRKRRRRRGVHVVRYCPAHRSYRYLRPSLSMSSVPN